MKTLIALFALVLGATLLSNAAAQDVTIAGSSTVFPVSLGMAEEFAIDTGLDVAVSSTGTGGGFTLFCNGESDINNASRPMRESEMEECAANGITAIEVPVAFDALTVAVNPDNDWATCMTVEQLQMLWEPDSAVSTWADIDSNWPAEEINLFGPATTSGTFDYFTEEIIGEGGASRTDYFPSEEDDILAENVSNDINGLVYLGFAYYINDTDRLSSIGIDNGDGCVTPSVEHIEDGTYVPLSRPLFIYVSDVALAENDAVGQFVEFYLDEGNRDIIADTGYALLDDANYASSLEAISQ
ncbi:MAG: PstS family phosphate ABC transporter substrate-binding protein [Deinococcota bacterium]